MQQQVLDRPSHAAPTQSAAPKTAGATGRFDVYSTIHKGIRAFLFDTIAVVGSMDSADADEVAAALAQARELLAFCQGHLEHENEFIHPAMQARRPDSAVRTADDHVAHLGFVVAFGAPGATPGDEALQLSDGMWAEARRFGASIVGGDLVAAPQWVISVTALGDLGGRAPVRPHLSHR